MTSPEPPEAIEWTDRYTMLGIQPPPPSEVCPGQCEGTGIVPRRDSDGEYRFETCGDCGGTGRRALS